MYSPNIKIQSLGNLGEITSNTNIPERIGSQFEILPPQSGDIIVIAHKAVSKAEGQVKNLTTIKPTKTALTLAAELGKDPRLVQVILDQTRQIIRTGHGVLICETHHGFICANAGVDMSNNDEPDTAIVLPINPDASARQIRAHLETLTNLNLAVIITDSFGRAWREGQCDIAIGVAGLQPLDDWRGRHDRNGQQLHATVRAVADQIAAAADLARTKDSGEPALLVRGLCEFVTTDNGPGVAPLLRDPTKDLFR